MVSGTVRCYGVKQVEKPVSLKDNIEIEDKAKLVGTDEKYVAKSDKNEDVYVCENQNAGVDKSCRCTQHRDTKGISGDHEDLVNDLQKKVSRFNTFCTVNAALVLLIISFCLVQILSKSDGSYYKDFYHLSGESGESVHGNASVHLHCFTCDGLTDTERSLIESPNKGNNRCCIRDVKQLIQTVKTSVYLEIQNVASRLGTLETEVNNDHEKLNLLQDSFLNDNTSREIDGRMLDTYSRSRIQQNGRILDILLSRSRFFVQLSGTAYASAISWQSEIPDRYPDNDVINVTSGGVFFLFARVRFQKAECDGSETFGYQIYQQYRDDIERPVARVYKTCTKGGRFDEDLTVQRIVHVSLYQTATFTVRYDAQLHKHISKKYKAHSMGLFEI